MRRALLLIALIAAVLATGLGWYGTRQYESLIVTRPFVVARIAIAPYTLVTAEMLTTLDLPAVLAQEQPVYVRPAEVVGLLSTTAIPTGTLIYRHQAVAAASFRYSDDPQAEIIALAVPPEQAVAGQIQPGQRVNVYRLSGGVVVTSQPSARPLATVLPSPPAVVELVVAQALVRGVTAAAAAAGYPVTILVLEVTPADARRLVQLLAEGRGAVDLWVSLAPLTPAPVPGSPSPAPRLTSPAGTAAASPTPTVGRPSATPRPMATPTGASGVEPTGPISIGGGT
jgi:hypothetical protein